MDDEPANAAATKLDIGFAWAQQGRQLLVVNILKETPTGFPPTPNVKATPACIIPAGQAVPLKMATSGWKSRSVSQLLDNETWTGLVREFARAVGFPIPRSIRDTPNSKEQVPENYGRYAACHAEKKLGLFFLSLQIRLAGISFDDALNGKLRDANQPLHCRRARIYLGHRPCKNCRDFLRLIRRQTGIDVRWAKCPLFSEHKRGLTFRPGIPRQIDAAPCRPVTRDTGANGADAMAVLEHEHDADDDTENEQETRQPRERHGIPDDDHENEDDIVVESVEADDLEKMEDAIKTLPVGNVTRARHNTTRDCDRARNRDKDAMPPPPALAKAARISVHSSPSPSVSMASVVDSTIADRRQRYPTYSSPPRRDTSAAPPSVWGGRSKPPVTACLVPPDEFWGLNGQDLTGVASPSQPAYGASYFFGTPSVASSQGVHDRQAQQQRHEPSQNAGQASDTRIPASPVHVYVPPYLRRLQRPLHARSSTPVIDLTDAKDNNNNNDVEFLHASPSFRSTAVASTSSPAANDAWHPPMRAVSSRQTPRTARRRRGQVTSLFPDLSSFRYTGSHGV